MNTIKEYIKTLLKLAINNNPEVLKVIRNSKAVVKNATEDAQGNLHSKSNGQFVSKGDSSTGPNHPQNIDTSKLFPVDFTQDDIDRFKEHGSVQKYYKKHILGTEITHPDERLGKIYFDDDGLGESKNINRPKNFYLIAKAPELVKSALYDRSEPASKHERNDKIVKFHLLYAKAKINTKFGSKTKLLQIKIAEDSSGKRYYFLRPVATEINNLTNSAIAKDVNNDNSSLLNSEANIIITDIQEDFNPDMKNNEVSNDKWITIHPNGEDSKGRPLLLKDGESPKEAIERSYKSSTKLKESSSEHPETNTLRKLLISNPKDEHYFRLFDLAQRGRERGKLARLIACKRSVNRRSGTFIVSNQSGEVYKKASKCVSLKEATNRVF